MLRFLFYCFIAYIALRFIKWLLRPLSSQSNSGRRRARSSQLVRCDVCGTFVTETSAMVVSGREFCSKSCARQGLHRA